MTATTPEGIAAELADARAELARRQARADAINAAEQSARHDAEVSHYREAYGPKSYAYRELRDAAKARLDEVAAAETFDLPTLFAAFLGLREIDARCASISVHGMTIDTVDPKEYAPGVAPAAQGRPTSVSALYERSSFWQYLDGVITSRANNVRDRHLLELQADAAEVVTQAGEAAPAAAAADTHDNK
jgi:hypothetical protein